MGAAAVVIALVSYPIARLVAPASWGELGLAGCTTALLCAVVMHHLVLNADERRTVVKMIRPVLDRS